MSAKDNGGPAFPGEHFTGTYIYPQDGITPLTAITEPHQGMTLRDYFAAKAMQALINASGEPLDRIAEVPEYAYQIADAMLKARES